MMAQKEHGHQSAAFEGVRFSLFGTEPLNLHKVRAKLIEGGGIDVGQDSSNCTHVIVDKLAYDDPICLAALSDGKMLVTGLWVDHCYHIGMPVDPTAIMYRPLRDLNGIPGAKPLTVCLTGYQRQDRDDIMTMVALMGAKFSKPLVANKVTHLVCYKFEGEKYELANKITRIKIVNHRWLEDCLTAWEILPESSYAKSGFELEMEAEVKDSDEEDVTYNDNSKQMHVGTLSTNPYPMSRQNVSRIITPTNANKSLPIDRNAISTILAKSEGLSSPSQHIQNKEPDILCPRGATFNGNVTLATSNDFAVDLVYTDGNAPKTNSSSSKFSSISYSRKNRKNDAPGVSYVKKNELCPEDKQSGILPGKRSLDLPSSSPKLQKTDQNLRSSILEPSVQSDIGRLGPEDNYDYSLVKNSSFSSVKTPQDSPGKASIFSEEPENKLGATSASGSMELSKGGHLNDNLNMEFSNDGKLKTNMEFPKGGNNTNSLSKPRSKAIGKRKLGSKSKFTPKTTENKKVHPLHSSQGTLQFCNSAVEEEMVKKCADIVEAKSTAAVETNIAGILHGNESEKASMDDKNIVVAISASDNEEPENKLGATKSLEVGKLNDNLNMELPKGGNRTNSLSKPRRKAIAKGTSSSKSKFTPKSTANKIGRPLHSSLQLSGSVVEEEMVKKCSNIVEIKSTAVETNVASLDDETNVVTKSASEVSHVASDNEEPKNKLGVTKSLEVGKLDNNLNMELPKGDNNTKPLSKPRRKVIATKRSGSKSKFTPEVTENQKGPPQPSSGTLQLSSSHVEEGTVKKHMEIVGTKSTVVETNVAGIPHGDETEKKVLQVASDKYIEDKSLSESEVRRSKVKKRPLGKISKESADSLSKKMKRPNDDENAKSMKDDEMTEKVKYPKRKRSVPAKELKKNTTEADKENMSAHKNVMQVGGEASLEITNVKGVLESASVNPKWFILSGQKLERKEFQQIIRRLKGKLCRDSHQWSYQATHFIVSDPLKRTEKFFAAAASGSWILKSDYLTASNEAGRFVEEEAYEWHKKGGLSENGAINLEAPRKWRLLKERTGHGAFYGMRIIVHGACIVPPLETLKHVIKAGDGTILATSPPYTRFLKSGSGGVDFAVVSPGMPRVDTWVQEFLRHEIPCISADYLVEYVCKPGYSLDKHVEYNTQVWAEKSLKKLTQPIYKEE